MNYNLQITYNDTNDIKDTVLDEYYKFIQEHYHEMYAVYSLYYSRNLLKYFCKNSIIITVYKNNLLIGLVICKYKNINILDKIVDVNFLCIAKQFRNLGLCKWMILKIKTKFPNIGSIYTRNSTVPGNNYIGKRDYYHMPINIQKLKHMKLLDPSYIHACNRETSCIKLVIEPLNDIFMKINEYNKNYLLYEKMSFTEYTELFKCDSFIHLGLYAEDGDSIIGYCCLYFIDTTNYKEKCKGAYLYNFFTSSFDLQDKLSFIQKIGDYILQYKLADCFYILDVLGKESFYKNSAFIKCNQSLYYYNHNINVNEKVILPEYNNLAVI